MEEEKTKDAAAENAGEAAPAADEAPGNPPGEAKTAEAAAETDAAGTGQEQGTDAADKRQKPEQAAAEAPAAPDWKDLYARLMADFDNFKKRTARDREETYRFAEADIIGDILPSVDNLALALDKAGNKEDPFVKGVQLVYDTLLKSLKDHGAEPFDSVGLELDTGKMEAIATLPSDTVAEGKVSIESKKGWMLKDKVLRAAQVVVSSGKQA